jgi:Rab proteins geranylgeranyltransferase component A
VICYFKWFYSRTRSLILHLIIATNCRAASKAGHSVLQVDPASHYGGAWASLRLDEFQAALGCSTNPAQPCLLGDELASSIYGSNILIKPTSSGLINNPNLYSLDISPHLLYGAGPMISLLLGSGAHHYTEYKLLQGTVLRNDENSSLTSQPVPSTRAEIFRDKTLSPLQKRTLMRFIKGLAEAMEGKGPFVEIFKEENMLFKVFMEKEGLDVHLQRCVAHGVLLQHNNEDMTCMKALELFKLYVESVGRYGIDTGPFLTPLYGCGELPQAFCRSAAVSGAVQILRCQVDDLMFGEEEEQGDSGALLTCTGIEIKVEEGRKQLIKAGKVAAGSAVLQKYTSKLNLNTETVITHRCVAIVDRAVEVDKPQALIVFPEAGPGGSTVWALQLSHSTAVCPEGQVVLHLWCCGGGEKENEGKGTSEMYLMPCLESLAECGGKAEEEHNESSGGGGHHIVSEKVQRQPRALFAACFSLKAYKPTTPSYKMPGDVVFCAGPSADVTFTTAVDEAKKCYWQLFPPSSPVEEENEASTALLFPLDEAVVKAQNDATANSVEQQQQQDGGGSGSGAADLDSDDEALQALKAALELLPSSTQ